MQNKNKFTVLDSGVITYIRHHRGKQIVEVVTPADINRVRLTWRDRLYNFLSR
jgi:hypothetical protein